MLMTQLAAGVVHSVPNGESFVQTAKRSLTYLCPIVPMNCTSKSGNCCHIFDRYGHCSVTVVNLLATEKKGPFPSKPVDRTPPTQILKASLYLDIYVLSLPMDLDSVQLTIGQTVGLWCEHVRLLVEAEPVPDLQAPCERRG